MEKGGKKNSKKRNSIQTLEKFSFMESSRLECVCVYEIGRNGHCGKKKERE